MSENINIQQIYDDYYFFHKQYDETQGQINKKIERLKKKQENMRPPHWKEYLILPVMRVLSEQLPDIQWDLTLDEMRSYGMRNECPIWGITKNSVELYIVFTHDGEKLYYDTGEKKNPSIPEARDLNGFNNVRLPVEDITQLVDFVKKQLELNEQTLSDNETKSSGNNSSEIE